MLKFKINMADALERADFNSYTAKKTKLLSQNTLKKIKTENMDISLKAIDSLCQILDMQPGAFLKWEPDEKK